MPILALGKQKKKREKKRKIPNQRVGESKKKRKENSDQGSEENRINIQNWSFGLKTGHWT